MRHYIAPYCCYYLCIIKNIISQKLLMNSCSLLSPRYEQTFSALYQGYVIPDLATILPNDYFILSPYYDYFIL